MLTKKEFQEKNVERIALKKENWKKGIWKKIVIRVVESWESV